LLSPEEFFLGIDGGGSKTAAVIVDSQGRIRGHGQAGSANYHTVGLETAVDHLTEATTQASRSAGCRAPLSAAWVGIAGLDNPTDHEVLLPKLRSLATSLRLTNDAELVLSALDSAVGVALIAGTGAVALGRDRSGTRKRASGWGHLMGDEGSGYYIGSQALQAVVRAIDGRGGSTPLVEGLMTFWKLSRPDDLLYQVYHRADKSDIARLAPLAFETAQAGDPVAQGIIRRAARELALAALTVGRGLEFSGEDLPLALGGSLLLCQERYREETLRAIRRERPIRDVVLASEPAKSAARAARQLPRDLATW
jgi:N-acetylglucosamine kinase-like BadF-type ATPase